MRHLLYIIVASMAASWLMACGGGSSAGSSRAEEARQRAAEAARQLIATDHSDTMAMQHSILDAKAIQSEYLVAGDTIAVRAFDEAFRKTLLTDDPDLAASVL